MSKELLSGFEPFGKALDGLGMIGHVDESTGA